MTLQLSLPVIPPCASREVRGYYSDRGALGPISDAVGVIVCTFEKANALVCRLLEEEALDSLGCVVVDELHMARRPACDHAAVSAVRFFACAVMSCGQGGHGAPARL